MNITITHPEGCAPYTENVVASNASTHIAARDSLASEAEALLHYMAAHALGAKICGAVPLKYRGRTTPHPEVLRN